MRYPLGVCILVILTSVSLSVAADVSAEDIEALVAKHQVQKAQGTHLSIVDPKAQAANAAWLAMITVSEPPPQGRSPASGGGAGHSLAEINNKLNNPGTDLAQLNFKFTWNQFEGNRPGSTSQDSVTLLFQPVLPFTLPCGGNIIVRPTIPVTWTPHFDESEGGFDENFGLGDAQLNVFYSRTDEENCFLWGLGGVSQFPTHTDTALGVDQYQLGPSGFAGMMGKWGSTGIFPQHLWNIGGSGGHTSLTVIQTWYWFNVCEGWQVGGSPIAEYDWATNDSGEAWTIPVNLGVQKTVKIGKTPVRLRLEGIYYVDQPDSFGPHWGLQFTFTPVVPNVFGSLFN